MNFRIVLPHNISINSFFLKQFNAHSAANIPLHIAVSIPAPLIGSTSEAASPQSIKRYPDIGLFVPPKGNLAPVVLFSGFAFLNNGEIIGSFSIISENASFTCLGCFLFGWITYKLYNFGKRKDTTTLKDWILIFFWSIFTHPLLDTFTPSGYAFSITTLNIISEASYSLDSCSYSFFSSSLSSIW